MAIHKVLVIGAGRVGRTIAHMLGAEEYEVRLGDARPEVAAAVTSRSIRLYWRVENGW